MTAAGTSGRRLDKATVVMAAMELADREGGENVSLAMLAEHLGIRSPPLYSHVDGLDGLRREMLLRYYAMMGDQIRRAAVARSRRDGLLAIASAYATFYSEHRGILSLSAHRDLGDKDLEHAMGDAVGPLLSVLRSYGLGRADRAHWIRIICTASYGFALTRRIFVLDVDADESYRRMIYAFADAIEATAPAADQGRPGVDASVT